MKKLWKSARKSFMKSKVAIVTLAILVFISSASFTMLNSSAISFQTSYETVMNEGNIHDFTIKPKWKITGNNNGLTLKKTTITQDTPDIDKSKNNVFLDYSNGIREIYMDALDPKLISLAKDQTVKNPSYKLDLSDAIIQYADKTHTKIKISGNIKIFLYTNAKKKLATSTAMQAKRDRGDKEKWTIKPIIINEKTKANEKTPLEWLADPNGWGMFDPQKSSIEIKKSGADIIASLEKQLTPYFVNKTFFEYKFDTSALTGVYSQVKFDWTKMSGKNYPFFSPSSNLQQVINDFSKVISNTKKHMSTYIYSSMTDSYLKNTVMSLRLKNNKTVSDYIYRPSNVESLFVSSQTEQFKVVSSRFSSSSVDKTVIFIGQKPGNKYSESEMTQGLNTRWKQIGEQGNKGKDDKTQGFKWTRTRSLPAVIGGGVASAINFVNFDSLQAVVSSSYVNENKLSTMTDGELAYFRNAYLKGKDLRELFAEFKRKRKVVTVDSTDYLISGIGTSPDFAFPIINHKNPLPNAKNQAILFTTTSGYQRIHDAFRSNETEEYLAFKFVAGVPMAIRNEIMKLIADDIQPRMSWPKSISILTEKDDVNEKIILAPQRIAFLSKIQKSISSIAYLITGCLAMLTIFIIIMVVKKQVNSERKTIGTLLANGYSKHKIAFSMSSIAFVIITIPAGLGYLVGYFSQSLFTFIFNNYWTLPLFFSQFSFITMFLVIALPMLVTMLTSYIFTRMELKGDLLGVVKESHSKSGGWMTSKLLGHFRRMGSKTKVTISLFTSNLSKMFLVFITSTIALISGATAFSIIGKFTYAQHKSAAPIHYTYKADLETPTSRDNQYLLNDLEAYGLEGTTWEKTINPDDMYKPYSTMNKKRVPYFHWIKDPLQELKDSKKLSYLKNRIQIKALLDITMSGVANPWSIAKATMPENQLNQEIQQDELFNKSSYERIADYKNISWYQKLKEAEKKIVKPKLEAILKQKWFIAIPKNPNYSIQLNTSTIPQEFKNYIFFSLKTQITNRMWGLSNNLPFMISYGNIVKDKNDEVYSQLSFRYKSKISNHSVLLSSRIIGLNENKNSMVTLSGDLMKQLKEFKMKDINSVDVQDDAIPVVINQYFKEAYGVKKGDILKIEITNHKDKNNFLKVHNTNIKVVGIDETYNGTKIYSLQKFVNNKLGFAPSKTESPIFNGVFTKNTKDPMIFKGVNLYAESNYYIGSSFISENDSIWKTIKSEIDNKRLRNNSVTDFESYIAAYSRTPFTLSMSNTSWTAMSEYAFKSTLDLTNKIVWVIEGIILIISILFIAIISSMVFKDNKKFIATTRTLGYTNREIRKMFFRSLMPSLVLAIIVAIPITMFSLRGIRYIIMSFGSILVPTTIIWWAIPSAFVLLLLIFIIIYRFTMRKFGNEEMLEAFKV